MAIDDFYMSGSCALGIEMYSAEDHECKVLKLKSSPALIDFSSCNVLCIWECPGHPYLQSLPTL